MWSIGLAFLDPLLSAAQDSSGSPSHQKTTQGPSYTGTGTVESTQRPSRPANPNAMPYDEPGPESKGGRGHARSHSGKGSGDSAKSRPSKPSQKAMLSRALQKANAAVKLDNLQDIAGARNAYGEACELLQQVLQRTSAQEDKRKLEAIVSIPSLNRPSLRRPEGHTPLEANTDSNAHTLAASMNWT